MTTLHPILITPAGEQVYLFTLVNKAGHTITLSNLGGTLLSWTLPNKHGMSTDIILGYNNASGMLQDNSYMGVIAGRYANRIANGVFYLDGVERRLSVNQPPNHLHGGKKGFNKVIWDHQLIERPEGSGVELNYFSMDMEEGYPGNLHATVTYLFDNEGALHILYKATTDKKTIVNLTNHAYFNLSGGATDVCNHWLQINASAYTTSDKNLIPTGVIAKVAGTLLDFTSPRIVGEQIHLTGIGGYDHNFVLDARLPSITPAATLQCRENGLTLEAYTTQPGLQLYTANHFDGSIVGKEGILYRQYYGLCLETQHYPDSPNKPDFPSVILAPGDVYQHTTIYKAYVANSI